MGISSNQARFLALTSRQIDLEHRIQQICQRRLRLTSELENVATSYNNKISNRQLYVMNTNNSGISEFTRANLRTAGYTLIGKEDNSADPIAVTKDVRWESGAGFRCFSLLNGSGAPANITISLSDLGLPDTATEAEATEAAVRSGQLSIGVIADEFSQSKTAVWVALDSPSGYLDYEFKDWRTIPAIADELYNGDDVDAENKYDKTVEEINAQDKKLQLEQTTIEVEYKAITSEKESVKKILDTNAQASFKYFS